MVISKEFLRPNIHNIIGCYRFLFSSEFLEIMEEAFKEYN